MDEESIKEKGLIVNIAKIKKEGKIIVSIAKRTGICQCGKKGKYGVWGKYYCKECFIKYLGKDPDKIAEEGGKGHSGMLKLSDEDLNKQLSQVYLMPESYKRPQLLQIPKGNKMFATLYLTHYPESKGIVGRSINYLVIYKGFVCGIIGGNSPPYSVKAIDEALGITKENRTEKLKTTFNNEVFRIIKPHPNLATMTLKEFRYQIRRDYKKKYEDELEALITFVEPPRTGQIYKADNWIYLGMTKGFGTTRRGKRWFDRKWIKKQSKYIFVFRYAK